MPRSLSEAARAKMLGAAAELVLTAGVSGFSVDEVARRSGVAKTTIYRHFPSGRELLIAALDGAIPVPPTPDNGSLREDLLEFLASVVPMFADATLRTLFFEIYAASAHDPELLRLHRSMMKGRAGPTQAIFDRARARGEISPDIDYSTAVEMMEGPFIVRAMSRPETLADLDLESAVDRILVMLKA